LAPSWLPLSGVKGGSNYGRLKRAELLGGDRWGSMAREKEGTTSMARRCERRRRRCSADAVREEERPGGLRGPNRPAGGWAKI
jgi:hypothetical protein